ncbi:MAG TPA: ABATE domain-containing protein [Candidatus Angelobacter sp.]|nr:ABATE domain-containing protein [Candidatus Angelobacter sp.]
MPEFIFHAGHLALDLVNTEQMSGGARVDLLESPAALLEWLRRSGAVTAAELNAREKLFLRDKGAANGLLERARNLRSGVREMAEALVSRRAVSARAMVAINSVLGDSPRVPELVRGSKGYGLEWRNRGSAEAALLAPVAEAAARLLAEGDHGRVRKCASPACILYFYDTTRSRTRNWCSMQGCGNRAKAARFYDRHHLG